MSAGCPWPTSAFSPNEGLTDARKSIHPHAVAARRHRVVDDSGITLVSIAARLTIGTARGFSQPKLGLNVTIAIGHWPLAFRPFTQHRAGRVLGRPNSRRYASHPTSHGIGNLLDDIGYRTMISLGHGE